MGFEVAEAKSGRTLAGLYLGFLRLLKRLMTDEAVVTEALTSRRRRLAEKPILRKAGRLSRLLPMLKSRVLLMVVSVRRARCSL